MKAIDLTGQSFGRLVVQRKSFDFSKEIEWVCLCSCGNTKIASTRLLRRGAVKSCGCLKLEELKSRATHGLSKTSEYRAWQAMQSRCSKSSKQKKDYYDRGIRVCRGWVGKGGFIRFIDYVGLKPTPNHSLDRINNNKGYQPDNVQWATSKQQVNNRSLKKIENFSDEEMIQEMNRRGFRTTKMKKHGKDKTN
jgi:hypothetical protein